jgi:hypothetical protein
LTDRKPDPERYHERALMNIDREADDIGINRSTWRAVRDLDDPGE